MSEPRRISIIGPESTGKSQLANQLAEHFKTAWVPEFARAYLDGLDREYLQEDLLQIAKGQLKLEDEKIGEADTYLFCDTDLIVIKIWSDYKYNSTDLWIEKMLLERPYDFYLLTNIDLAWEADPQREHPKKRKYFFDKFETYLKEQELPYAIISGAGNARLECAINSLEKYFVR